jgi:hypothetical protein
MTATYPPDIPKITRCSASMQRILQLHQSLFFRTDTLSSTVPPNTRQTASSLGIRAGSSLHLRSPALDACGQGIKRGPSCAACRQSSDGVRRVHWRIGKQLRARPPVSRQQQWALVRHALDSVVVLLRADAPD